MGTEGDLVFLIDIWSLGTPLVISFESTLSEHQLHHWIPGLTLGGYYGTYDALIENQGSLPFSVWLRSFKPVWDAILAEWQSDIEVLTRKLGGMHFDEPPHVIPEGQAFEPAHDLIHLLDIWGALPGEMKFVESLNSDQRLRLNLTPDWDLRGIRDRYREFTPQPGTRPSLPPFSTFLAQYYGGVYLQLIQRWTGNYSSNDASGPESSKSQVNVTAARSAPPPAVAAMPKLVPERTKPAAAAVAVARGPPRLVAEATVKLRPLSTAHRGRYVGPVGAAAEADDGWG